MRLFDMNWMQVEEYLKGDDRIVVPIGSTEQHAYLSLGADAILAERIALDAAEPLGVPVLPVLAYGVTPYFLSYPGTVSLRIQTYLAVIRDVLDSLAGHGFRRIVVVNGHGGNAPAGDLIREWVCEPRDARVRVRFHTWCTGPELVAAGDVYDTVQMHAGWIENYPWTRVDGAVMPEGESVVIPRERMRELTAAEVRALSPDGSMGGRYQREDAVMDEVWAAGVAEVRAVIENDWERLPPDLPG